MAKFEEYYENPGGWFYQQLLIAAMVCDNPKNSAKYISKEPIVLRYEKGYIEQEITINGTTNTK